MFAIANERKSLWQWDLNQQLTVDGNCTEVHYLNRGAPSTLTVAVKDGKADIPNILLQKAGRLVVYAYIIDAQDHHTKVCETFGIAPRPKPAEYVYTETEVKTWSDLQSQIGDLADLATDEKDSLVAAINEAAQSGGGAGAWYVTVTPGTNHSATADKTAAEVYEAYEAGKAVYCILLDAIRGVPVVLPLLAAVNIDRYLFCFAGSGAPRVSDSAPLSLTVTYDGTWHYFRDGLVSGELVNSVSSSSTNKQVPSAKCVYDELQKRNLKQATSEVLGGVKADPATADDTQPVRIDDSGKLVTAAGNGDISLGLTSATVGQTIKVKTVDTDGRPTSWEAADMVSGSSGEVWEKVADTTLTEQVNSIRVTFSACSTVYVQFQWGGVESDLGNICIAPNCNDTFYTGERRAAAASITTSTNAKRGYAFIRIDTRVGSVWTATSSTLSRADGSFGAITPDALMNCDVGISNKFDISMMQPFYFTIQNEPLSNGVHSITAYGAGMAIGTTLKVWGIKK